MGPALAPSSSAASLRNWIAIGLIIGAYFNGAGWPVGWVNTRKNRNLTLPDYFTYR